MSNAEIGRHLCIGEGTVYTHVSRILVKLGARDRVHYETSLKRDRVPLVIGVPPSRARPPVRGPAPSP
ncbi:helix-turn-helix transcriptional regulator [Amycolatopsis sp. NPDC058278]|uniref:helix-turn-helix domain-containing protein n=1 Tax=Amycolatopsis sp. NPDC058278 TaxID=3346417 RepID=UPI0036DE7948